jgi:hypothetical protein
METDASQDVYSDAPTEITIEGKVYTIDPLRQGHVCRVIKWMKAQWMETFLEQTRMVPLPPEERGITLSAIACKTPTFMEVLDQYEAKLKLLSLHLKADGSPLKMEYIRDEMKPRTCGTLLDIMLGISKKKDGDDPLGRTTSTTPTETAP